jgi:hypothetical protein
MSSAESKAVRLTCESRRILIHIFSSCFLPPAFLQTNFLIDLGYALLGTIHLLWMVLYGTPTVCCISFEFHSFLPVLSLDTGKWVLLPFTVHHRLHLF